MRGKLNLCYHKEDGSQRQKELARIVTSEDSKSFHLDFVMNDKAYSISLYDDCFSVEEAIEGEEEGKILLYLNEEGEASSIIGVEKMLSSIEKALGDD